MRRLPERVTRLYRHWVRGLPYLSLPALRAAEPAQWTHAYVSPTARNVYVMVCIRDRRWVNTMVMRDGRPAVDYCGKPFIVNPWAPGVRVMWCDGKVNVGVVEFA